MITNQREWKPNKIAVLILVILALLVITRSARLIFLREYNKASAISVFKKQCAQIVVAIV